MLLLSRPKFRKADIVQWLSVLTLGGILWTAYAKAATWDQVVKDMNLIKPKIESQEINTAVLIARLNSIDKHLESIDRKTP